MYIVNVERANIPNQSENETILSYVLISGTPEKDRDYAVYMGIGTPEFVAYSGAKLRYEAAKIHFPFLPKAKYRG